MSKYPVFISKYFVGKTPEQTMDSFISDGWFSCSAPQYEKIYYFYKKTQSYQKTCDEFSIDKRTLYNIIHRFE